MFRKYIALMKGGIMEMLHFRLSIFVLIGGNLLYLAVVYFLWKAIFDSAGTESVNGMTFESTLIYLVLASALFNFMEMYVVWNMGRAIQSGKIVLHLIRPMDYKNYQFWEFSGNLVVQFVTTFFPTFIAVAVITKGAVPLGWNLIPFIISVVLAIIINYDIDFIVGTVCLYTESIWGINIMKQVIVLLFSGATIPLAFFPEGLRKVACFLPFRAVYDSPLTILLGGTQITEDVMNTLLIQLIWVVILGLFSRGFWKISLRQITVNGG